MKYNFKKCHGFTIVCKKAKFRNDPVKHAHLHNAHD